MPRKKLPAPKRKPPAKAKPKPKQRRISAKQRRAIALAAELEKIGRQAQGQGAVSVTDIREQLRIVFDRLGGVEAMRAWAVWNATDFYKIYAKLVPLEVDPTGGKGIHVHVTPEEGKF